MHDHESRLGRFASLAYAAPAVALAAVGVPLYIYIPKFYTDELGVNIAWMGGVILAARLLDAVLDPVAGVVSDTVRTRCGRRRPFIALGSLGLAAVVFAIYAPPPLPAHGYAIWFTIFILALSVVWTVVDVPWESLGPEITFDYDERTRLFGLRDGFFLLGTLLAVATPAALDFLLEDTGRRGQMRIFAIVYAPVLLAACWWCVLAISERRAEQSDTPNPPLGRGLKIALANRPFLVLLASYAVSSVAANLPATLILYYVEYVLGSNLAEVFLLEYFVVGIAFLPLWVWAAERMGKKRAWIASMSVNTLAFAGVFFLGRGDESLYAILVFASGTGFGASLALFRRSISAAG